MDSIYANIMKIYKFRILKMLKIDNQISDLSDFKAQLCI